jgi:two-component system LytT family sensor kinase
MDLSFESTATGSSRLRRNVPGSTGAKVEPVSFATYAAAWCVVIALFVTQRLAFQTAWSQWDREPSVLALCVAIFWFTRALIALPFFVWMQKHTFNAETWAWRVVQHCCAMLVFVTIELIVFWALGQVLRHHMGDSLVKVIAAATHLDVLTYAVLLGAVHARLYARTLREREREAREFALSAAHLQTQLAEARLAALRMQLQPHFLFNALNAISALIRSDPEAADRMLERLSDLLRNVLEHDGAPEVPLSAELEIVESYLAMQQLRFGDRLHIDREVAPETLDAYVPALILQPLVENAIRHGIKSRAGGGRVVLRSSRQRDLLLLEVEDDGIGLPDSSERGSFGIGLANTHARLEQLHGHSASVAIEPVPPGGMRVVITIPWRALEATA